MQGTIILDEDSTDAAEQDDSLGYFSDEELQDDEKEEVTDDDFYSLLNEDVLENDTAMKVGNAAVGGDANYEDYHQTFEVEEQHHTYMKTPELENKKHFKSVEEQHHTFMKTPELENKKHFKSVEEQQHTYMKTPELENKKQFKSDEVDSPDKSDEVDSPDVICLSEFLRTPPPKKK